MEFPDEDFYRVCRHASAWYEAQLYTAEAEHVRAFLEERGMDETACREWQLGYCPEEKTNELLTTLEEAGNSLQLILAAGILFHDRRKLRLESVFAQRLIIPKQDITGSIAGFGGRLLQGGTPFVPKYIQSAETPVYSMYRLLFGLHRAAPAIAEKKTVVITEGYFDVIQLHKHGILNSVAVSGKHISKEQIETLQQHCSSVIVLFDGDGPGRDGAAVVTAQLQQHGMEVQSLELKGGEDPDSWLRKEEGMELVERLNWLKA